MIGDDAPRGLTHFELLSACWTGFQPYLGGDQNTLADGLNAGVVTSDGLMIDIVLPVVRLRCGTWCDRVVAHDPIALPCRRRVRSRPFSSEPPAWLATKST